jgi:hypothetical protein
MKGLAKLKWRYAVLAGALVIGALAMVLRQKPASADAGDLRPAPRVGVKSPQGTLRPARSGGGAQGGSNAVAEVVGDLSQSDEAVSGRLFAMVEDIKRPLPERLEALEHALNLTTDEPARLLALAARVDLPLEISDCLLADSLNRPPRIQGLLLINLLQHLAGNPRNQALDYLAALVGDDVVAEPVAWRQAVEKLP